jgi:hypothetical protein
MGDSIDLLILPLARTGGQEQPGARGLYVSTPPRKSARFRGRDRLALHLALDGNAPLPAEQINQILGNLAKSYYSTSGTVTTALRKTGESLNQFLLDRNLRNSSTGRQSVGYLTQIVLRDTRLSIAQSGLSHAYILSASGATHVHDLHLAGNGLGLSRTTSIRFSQVDLQPNDAIIITLQPPASWTLDKMDDLRGQGPESLRRKLLASAGSELEAFMLHAHPGSGELRLLRPVRQPRPVPTSPASQMTPDADHEKAETPETQLDDRSPIREGILSAKIAQESATSQPAPNVDLSAAGEPPPEIPIAVTTAQGTTSAGTVPPSTKQAQPSSPESGIDSTSRGLLNSLFLFIAKTITSLKSILPDSGIFTLPPATMAFTAIAVPLIIVAVAVVVYYQRGRDAQYDIHFSQAQETAQVAEVQTDPREQRIAWNSTLLHLDNAEYYQTTEDSKALRLQAQGVVDTLDVINRLDFRPLITDQLDETAEIIRLVATDDGLYMLNATGGLVERAISTNEGFRLDTTFQCGPGPSGGYIIDPIVDIAPMPAGNDLRATILAIDANGNLLRCIPGDTPLASPMEPPDINWGTPRAIKVNNGDLYVLDPQINAVWIYRGMDVSQSPRQFFDQQIPPMGDVIDMDISQNDLYLLHEDGHLTTCVYSALATSPTRCEEPAIYTDPRTGRQSGPFIEDAFFSEIYFSPPPEPTIYLLDPNSQSIYRFSVKLTFDRQHRSQDPLPNAPASAFTIDRNSHTIYMAIGDEVYFAPLP